MKRRPFTKRQNEFLRLWSETGRGRMSIHEFCSKNGYPKSSVYQWRARDAAFRSKMDAVEVKVPDPSPPKPLALSEADRIAKLAAKRWPDLPAWQRIYLEVWRDSVDRDTACRHVEREWREIREARKESKAFDQAAREIEEVFQVRVEDAEERAAIAGRAASTGRYLEAKSSKLAKSAGKAKKGDEGAKSEDPKATAERYAEIFKAHASRGAGTDVTN